VISRFPSNFSAHPLTGGVQDVTNRETFTNMDRWYQLSEQYMRKTSVKIMCGLKIVRAPKIDQFVCR
jgi:hypothetical protein